MATLTPLAFAVVDTPSQSVPPPLGLSLSLSTPSFELSPFVAHLYTSSSHIIRANLNIISLSFPALSDLLQLSQPVPSTIIYWNYYVHHPYPYNEQKNIELPSSHLSTHPPRTAYVAYTYSCPILHLFLFFPMLSPHLSYSPYPHHYPHPYPSHVQHICKVPYRIAVGIWWKAQRKSILSQRGSLDRLHVYSPWRCAYKNGGARVREMSESNPLWRGILHHDRQRQRKASRLQVSK